MQHFKGRKEEEKKYDGKFSASGSTCQGRIGGEMCVSRQNNPD